VKLVAHHANIKDSEFNIDWFQKFDIVFNALDNLDARRHVNKMCLAADVPLVESGTTGFNGQVQIIKKVSKNDRCGSMAENVWCTGADGVLRLQYERGSKKLSCLHNTEYAKSANPLHSLGKKLPIYVCLSRLKQGLARLPSTVKYLVPARMMRQNWITQQTRKMARSPVQSYFIGRADR